MQYILIALPLVAAALLISYFIKTGNTMTRQLIKIDEAASGIDVALTKRFDTLTKLLDVTKGYAKHEQETILQSIQLRQGMSIPEKYAAESMLDKAGQAIVAVAEGYPELKAAGVFIELQKAAADTEEHLQAARRLYNSNVSAYNQTIAIFPKNVVANMKGLRERPMYEAAPEKRDDVKVSF